MSPDVPEDFDADPPPRVPKKKSGDPPPRSAAAATARRRSRQNGKRAKMPQGIKGRRSSRMDW